MTHPPFYFCKQTKTNFIYSSIPVSFILACLVLGSGGESLPQKLQAQGIYVFPLFYGFLSFFSSAKPERFTERWMIDELPKDPLVGCQRRSKACSEAGAAHGSVSLSPSQV